MATVIDSLVVELGLDANQFKEGSREVEAFLDKAKSVTTRLGESVEGSAHKITEVFTALKGGFGGLLGVLGGAAIGSFIDRVIQMDAHTSRLARSLGTNTRELSIWQGIVKQVGGTAEEASASFAAMSDAMAGIQAGAGIPSGPQAMVMARAGIRAGMPVTEILDRLAQFSEKSQAGGMSPQMVRFFLQQFPGMSQGMINALMGGTKELERMRKAAADLAPLEEERAKQAEAMSKDFAQLDLALIRLARETFPVLTNVINDLTGIIKGVVSMDWAPDWLKGMSQDKLNKFMEHPARGAFGFLQGSQTTLTGNAATNSERFLKGLSGLESPLGDSSKTSSARGYFQFLSGTAQKAMGAGIADPREGTYDQQAAATWAYIKRFYPKAAEAIERGDFAGAIPMLNKEWPSLPGGSQQQGAGNYRKFGETLGGGAPPPAPTPGAGATSSNNTSSVTIGTLNVTSNKADPKEVAEEIPEQWKRMLAVAPSNYGLT
jgi:hypothetical protein